MMRWWRGRASPRLRWLQSDLREEAQAELEFHIEGEIDRLEGAGVPREEARRRVVAEMGDLDRIAWRLTTIARRQRVRRWLAGQVRGTLGDARSAVRTLGRRPGLSGTMILTLAVGIAGSTTMLSVIDGVAWRPLPYPESDRLVRVAGTFPTGGLGPVPGPLLADWQQASSSFEALAGAMVESKDLEQNGGEPARLRAGAVSPEYGALTGLEMTLGRWFTVDDDLRDGPALTVLGHGLWLNRWGGDPGIVGRDIVLDGQPVTVLGVLSAEHEPPVSLNLGGVQLWIPLRQAATDVATHDNWFLRVVGLRRPDVEQSAALAELQSLTDRLVDDYGIERYREGFAVQLEDLRANTVASAREPVRLLMVAAVLLLLVACANVSTLCLLRSRERAAEFGTRRSLGASRAGLIRQLLVESLVLAGLAGLIGGGLATAGIRLFSRFDPGDLPRVGELALDGRFVGIAVVVVFLTGLLSGLVPAVQLSRSSGPGGTSRSVTSDRGASRLRGTLVAIEVALSLTLVTGSALLAASISRMVRVDPGFEPAGVHVIHLELARRYDTREQRTAFFYELADVLRGLPGVTSVGMGNGLPFGGGGAMGSVEVDGEASADLPDYVRWQLVDEGFFPTLGVEAADGRLLDAGEVSGGAARVIVNRSFARAAWGSESAVGRRLKVIRTGDQAPWLEVVGVLEDFRQGRLDREVVPEIYVPLSQPPFVFPSMDFVVRGNLPPQVLAGSLREAVWRVDGSQPIGWIETLDRRIRASLARHHFYGAVLGVFGAAALFLVATGIYGTVATSIGQRRREIGVRMALGASRRRVRDEMARVGMIWISAGILAGVGLSAAGLKVTESLLYDVSVRDPASYAVAAACLAIVGAAAVLLPTRRLSRIDPSESLRAG